jgi:hypothetical protein
MLPSACKGGTGDWGCSLLSLPNLPLTGPHHQGMQWLPVLTTTLLSFETTTSSLIHSLPMPTLEAGCMASKPPPSSLWLQLPHHLGSDQPSSPPHTSNVPCRDTPHHHPPPTCCGFGPGTTFNGPSGLPHHPPPTSCGSRPSTSCSALLHPPPACCGSWPSNPWPYLCLMVRAYGHF